MLAYFSPKKKGNDEIKSVAIRKEITHKIHFHYSFNFLAWELHKIFPRLL
jgi:hypothetical protein